ncbi:SDR family NAD(P)-dependent oxidoreductase [Salinibacter ruber]|uniref:SDR family NAD(P)-dependent oxidoreductase n=1 Tax=Salinibacter ruber TaxID=146919 RepID=UPI0021679826|nr:SDR family oxidoreductase [Salinibacter ruber]MCS4174836.1 NAD(P)-dependent dehydrogenase (short-subunit alcohol dehydrogenase family) [Salinibacter ruber]
MSKYVLITGVAGGIGSATAQLFAEHDWHVIGVDREDEEIKGVDHFIQADISDADASADIFKVVEEEEGRLDALVNNAAIQICKPVVEMTPDEWDATMASNLRSVFLGVRNAHSLLDPGGAIVNVSSVHAVATSSEIAAYAASKGGLLAFTRALSIEFSDDDIRVNAVLPGAVDTEMLRDGLERDYNDSGTTETVEERMQALGTRHVIGRVGQPEEIAQTILFLADGERSSFVTGQALTVDGGATARLSTE